MGRLGIARRYLAATLSVAAVVSCLLVLGPGVNLTTTGLALVLAITLISMRWGSGPGIVASLAALLSFNYFFIPPVHTWTIHDPENLVAFVVFFVTALTVGQLSSRSKREAVEAEARRREIEGLYSQLQKAFEEASEAETLRRSERLKSALLDAVTHDLRTPLTSIKASVTTLLGGVSAPEAPLPAEISRELLLVIDEESDRLDRFVEEMMTVARIEGGQLLLRRSPVGALEIINNAIDRAAAILQDHPVEVTVDPKLPPLLVDGASTCEVVFELLENAAKYSGGGAPIHVLARCTAPGQVEIAVEDRGIGIPAEIRTRVFDKFFRAPGPHRDSRGFGMGLSIARGIVEAHGGRIWIEEGAQGRGTMVRFTVPCPPQVQHEPDAVQDLSRR